MYKHAEAQLRAAGQHERADELAANQRLVQNALVEKLEQRKKISLEMIQQQASADALLSQEDRDRLQK